MATEASRSGASSADSYIGSLISLTSKSEIRYEGVLFNINTEESSIGLRNVRSFGSEGRKKDGPQIPASDKIYDYILFRGKDIKDLQVKSSPPPQPAPIHNDPAIIQSHYSRSAPSSTSLSSIASGATTDGSQTAQLGLTRPTFQGDLSPYQAGGNLGSWGPTPPTANVSGLAVPPVYWQGYYAPSGGLPHLQPPMLQQPPGLALPSSMQQSLQYPVLNTSLPSGLQNLTDYPPLLFPPVSNSLNLTSSTLPSASAPAQASVLAPEPSVNLISNKPPATSLPATSLGPSPPLVVPLTSNLESVFSVSSSMPSIIGSQSRPVASTMLPHQTASHSIPSNVASSISNQVETLRTSVTHGQLLQPGSSTLPSSQSSKMIIKEVDTKPPEAMVKPAIHESSVSAVAGAKEPILPLPTPTNREPNGIALHSHQNNRGRGRGRGRGNAVLQYQRPVTQFSEDFDFIAMNEKFNKDEVWGHLGKNKAQLRDREGDIDNDYADDEEDDAEAVNLEVKPVYVKDEFFDSLSCNTLDHGSRYGRPKFSEQMKIDTETFGDFSRQRSGRGRGRGFRGGGRGRGSYYGRGYGYAGRGSRGYPTPNRGP